MAEIKTKPTEASVDSYLASLPDQARRADCDALVALMGDATRQPARMWGPAIVGFGVLNYKYANGKDGEICLVGFSSRKGYISIYGAGASAPGREQLLARLGKHKAGKGCINIGKLADIDLKVLRQLIDAAVEAKSP